MLGSMQLYFLLLLILPGNIIPNRTNSLFGLWGFMEWIYPHPLHTKKSISVQYGTIFHKH